jgi:hypothetical protein
MKMSAQNISHEEDKHYSFIVWKKVGFLIFIINILLEMEEGTNGGFVYGYRVSVWDEGCWKNFGDRLEGCPKI